MEEIGAQSPGFIKAPSLHACVRAKLLQLCPILCGPMDCSLPGSSVHGILQARILEWIAMPSSRASSLPRDQTCVYCNSALQTDSLPWRHWGSPPLYISGAK